MDSPNLRAIDETEVDMRTTLVFLLLVGCAAPIPEGTSRIVVRPDTQAEITVSLYGEMFSETRSVMGRPEQPARIDGLGAGRYRVAPSWLPRGRYPVPESVLLDLHDDEGVRVDFHSTPGALVRAQVELDDRTRTPVAFEPMLLVAPDEALDLSFLALGEWVRGRMYAWKAGARQCVERDDPWVAHLEAVIEPSPKPRRFVVAGPVLTVLWGNFLHSPELLSAQLQMVGPFGDTPYAEPVLVRGLGPARAGDEADLGRLVYPVWTDAATGGRFRDASGRPTEAYALILPEGDGTGAFVVSDEDGHFRLPPLPAGRYRALIEFVSGDALGQRIHLFELDTATERLDLRVEE